MNGRITPDMTLLDVAHRYRATEAVFRARDEQAGESLLCNALFETVADAVAPLTSFRRSFPVACLASSFNALISFQKSALICFFYHHLRPPHSFS